MKKGGYLMQNTLMMVQLIASVFCIITPIVAAVTLVRNIKINNIEDVSKKIEDAKEEGARNANILNAINSLTEKVDRLVDNQVDKDTFKQLERRVCDLEKAGV